MAKFVFLLPNLQKLGNYTRRLSKSGKHVQHLNPAVVSKHTIQKWDEEMARNKTGGDNQQVRRRPVQNAELADATQENTRVAALRRRQSQQEAVPPRFVDE